MALTQVRPEGLGFVNGRRNLIINGAMRVAQRGTSFTSTGYTLDRMQMLTANTDNVAFTTTQSSTAPDGFASSLKVDITTAESALDSDELFRLLYKAEGQDLQQLNYGSSAATSVTLSFYVRSNVTGVYAVEFRLNAAGTSAITKQYTINSANTWERKTLTLPANTATAIDNDSSNGLEIGFALAAGSNFTTGALGTSWASTATASRYAGQAANVMSSASNEWLITGIQLEVGTNASDFEYESFAETLQKCRRYFIGVGNIYSDFWGATGSQMVGVYIGASGNNGYMPINVLNPTQMRATPTAAINGTPKFTDFAANRNNITGVGITSQHLINFTYDGSQRTANEGIGVNASDGGVGISLSAEL
jgi:hypothetical protein